MKKIAYTLLLFFVPVAVTFAQTQQIPENYIPELATPNKALHYYFVMCKDGDYENAAKVLGKPKKFKKEELPELARQLKFVMNRVFWVDMDKVSDDLDGPTPEGKKIEYIGNVKVRDKLIDITLVRQYHAGKYGWYFSKKTVLEIPEMYEVYGPGWLGRYFPESFFDALYFEIYLWQWTGLLLVSLFSACTAYAIAWIILFVANKIAKKTKNEWDDELVEVGRNPMRLFILLAIFYWIYPTLRFSIPAQEIINRILNVGFILSIFKFLLNIVDLLGETIEKNLVRDATDKLRIRGIKTQVTVLKRVLKITMAIFGIALILSQFEVVRKIGVSLLASAGIMGIVIGLAAQQSISSILAGIQLAITQPIRLGDVVIAEGEWGTIEEINLTYVVVKIWDLRRLVIPIRRFLDSPFQNWTKTSPDLMGTVFVFADYTIPVEKLRKKLKAIVEEKKEFWDGKVCGLQVTNTDARTVELRALVSSEDSSKLWDLRCFVREELIKYIQNLENGKYLPKHRVEGKDMFIATGKPN
ncbi:MAG: mechanosensitive ion channel family protein [Leptospiraceae bacterium]|nr:mechanosensitive ion channel family protein [Leptospiraceae bacterium]